MGDTADFVETPLEGFLDKYTREQLLKTAELYKINIDEKRLKDIVKGILKPSLVEMGF